MLRLLYTPDEGVRDGPPIPMTRGQPVTLGRSENELSLDDARASRQHASIWWRGGKIGVDDHGSRNGTFVGSRRVEGSVELADGDVVRVGDSLLVVRQQAGPQAPPLDGFVGDAPGWLERFDVDLEPFKDDPTVES